MSSKHMSSSIINITLVILMFINTYQLFAQEKSNDRKFGLTSSLQEGHLDICIPFWAGQKTVIAPAFSFLYVEDGGTDFGLGLVLRFYGSIKRLAPYFGGRFGTLLFSPQNDETKTDFMTGIFFGGEFFLHPQFSIAVETQANATFSHDESNRFGNPGGANINTASVIIANVYF